MTDVTDAEAAASAYQQMAMGRRLDLAAPQERYLDLIAQGGFVEPTRHSAAARGRRAPPVARRGRRPGAGHATARLAVGRAADVTGAGRGARRPPRRFGGAPARGAAPRRRPAAGELGMFGGSSPEPGGGGGGSPARCCCSASSRPACCACVAAQAAVELANSGERIARELRDGMQRVACHGRFTDAAKCPRPRRRR